MTTSPKKPRTPHLNQTLAHHSAQDAAPGKKPGKKKGAPKSGGRVKGTPNSATIEKEAALQDAMREVFGKLSPKEVDNITPLEVLQYCTVAAVKAHQWGLALMAAEKWAPYMHAKLAPKIIDDPEKYNNQNKITIIGGLPDSAVSEVAVTVAGSGSNDED